MSKIEPGTYKAKPIDWRVGKSSLKETPYIEVTFGFKNKEGSDQTVRWTGYFSDKTRERTVKALVLCGLTDDKRLHEGVAGKALNINKEVEIVVENETSEKGTFAKVKWVNQLGGAKFRDLAPPTETKSIVQSLNLKADILAMKQSLGENTPPPASDEDEPLPF